MKTVSDIAAFLKRNHTRELTAYWSEKNQRFEIVFAGRSAMSKHLDNALENLAEDMRRAANGTQLQDRSSAAELTQRFGGPTTTKPVNINPIYQVKSYIPMQVTAACGTKTADGAICPSCSNLPGVSISGVLSCSCCYFRWRPNYPTGTKIKFHGFPEEWEFNGSNYDKVTS